jgi:hypothetical protein
VSVGISVHILDHVVDAITINDDCHLVLLWCHTCHSEVDFETPNPFIADDGLISVSNVGNTCWVSTLPYALAQHKLISDDLGRVARTHKCTSS